MSRDPLPEPWRSVLEPKGVDSRRGLATKAGIAVQTAVRLVDGVGAPSQRVIDAVAEALFNGDRNRVRELAGMSGQDYGEWTVPSEIALLDPQQRAAVEAVIKAMVPAERRGGGHGGDTASMKRRQGSLSVAPGTVPLAVAADEQEQSIAGEQEESDTP